MSVKPEHRIVAWNITVFTGPDQRCGFYQANDALTYAMIFADLFTCFPELKDPNLQSGMALHQQREIVTGEGKPTDPVSFIYLSDSQACQQPVPVLFERQAEYVQPTSPRSVPYHLITHDRGNCALGRAVLSEHLSVGCARYLPDLAMRPDLHNGGNYHLIDSLPDSPISPAESDLEGHHLFESGSPTMSPTPTTPTSVPSDLPAARIPSPGGGDTREAAILPAIERVRAPMAPVRRGPELRHTEFRKAIKKPTRPRPHGFESAVKTLASFRCIISGQSNDWVGGMLGGPGLEACHIVPKALYWDYPPGIPLELTAGKLEKN
ncbi:MAG: hypothetical protein M1816_007548 [Peltula sp. TS41687]|nr:MAG: hypothetical protein M1816_007548 [Peltula sp. TS41687]